MRFPAVMVVLLLAGCASAVERPIKENLIGSWKQKILILGRERESIITFRPNGTFEEATQIVMPNLSMTEPLLTGKWSVSDKLLTLNYSTGFTGSGTPEQDQRRVIKLDAWNFVSADLRFGIVVDRERVLVQGRK